MVVWTLVSCLWRTSSTIKTKNPYVPWARVSWEQTTMIMMNIVGICIVWLTLCYFIVWSTLYTIMHEIACNINFIWTFNQFGYQFYLLMMVELKAIENDILKSLNTLPNAQELRENTSKFLTCMCFLKVHVVDLCIITASKWLRGRK